MYLHMYIFNTINDISYSCVCFECGQLCTCSLYQLLSNSIIWQKDQISTNCANTFCFKRWGCDFDTFLDQFWTKNAYLKYICYLSKLIMQQHTDIPFAVFIHQIFPLHIIIALNSHEQLTMNLHTVSIAVAQPSAFVTPIYDAPWSKWCAGFDRFYPISRLLILWVHDTKELD